MRWHNITLYTSQLSNSSKEYVGATIFHEVVHAWIDYQYRTSSDRLNQHNMLADSYRFNKMRDALMEMFPSLSMQDATDLTWGGLQQTIQWNMLPILERERILQKNLDFKAGKLG